MQPIKVLFICTHNSARSQMAEAFLKKLGGDHFTVQSAGITPGEINPLAIAVMAEIGIDISNNKTQSVSELVQKGDLFEYVIAVCDKNEELLKQTGLSDASTADFLDRVDQTRQKRPWQKRSRRDPFVLHRPTAGTSS